MNLPYSIEVIRDSDEENPGWVAKIKELPGCLTQADTFEELEGMIQDALRNWIEVALEDGIPIEVYSNSSLPISPVLIPERVL